MPRGPRVPRWLQTLLMWVRPIPWLTWCHRRYGDLFSVWARPWGRIVYVADPESIKAVFSGDPAVYHAGDANRLLRGLIGESSIGMLDERPHRDRRRAMMRDHRTAVERQAGAVAMVHPEMLDRFPWRGARRRRRHADALLLAEIADRRADPRRGERVDVLATLVDATDDHGRPMSDLELRDQLVTLLFAGHENTASALAWALERLTRTPEVLARAVEAAADGDDAYLDAVLNEILRLHPTAPCYRTLTEPVVLGGHHLPAGTTLILSAHLVQHSGAHYPDPERFDPDRMLGAVPPVHTWLPYGGGIRRSLGATPALVEMRIMLREILLTLALEPTTAPGEPIKVRHVIQVPARGGRTTVAARRDPVRPPTTVPATA